MAANNGHLNVVEYLVDQGANIHVLNDALRYAARNGHLNVVEYLVNQGADIHANDDEALRFAARNGRLNVVEYLKNEIKNEHQCIGITKKKERCKKVTQSGCKYCHLHNK